MKVYSLHNSKNFTEYIQYITHTNIQFNNWLIFHNLLMYNVMVCDKVCPRWCLEKDGVPSSPHMEGFRTVRESRKTQQSIMIATLFGFCMGWNCFGLLNCQLPKALASFPFFSKVQNQFKKQNQTKKHQLLIECMNTYRLNYSASNS